MAQVAKATTASTAIEARRSPPGRVHGADKVVGVSTSAIAHSDAKSDPWNNGDGHALFGMKDVNVRRAWEVQSGRVSGSETFVGDLSNRAACAFGYESISRG